MKSRIISILAILFLGIGLFTACNKQEAAKEEGVYYTCPMHPTVHKDEPGQCPVCGMDLVKKEVGHEEMHDENMHKEDHSDHKH